MIALLTPGIPFLLEDRVVRNRFAMITVQYLTSLLRGLGLSNTAASSDLNSCAEGKINAKKLEGTGEAGGRFRFLFL